MAPTYLIKINNVDLTSYLKVGGYKVQRNKLWTEAGRNMSGTLRATFIGIFPKIMLEFRSLTASEMKTIVGLLDNASFNVSWWDIKTETHKSGVFYAGDFEPSMLSLNKNRYDGFSVNLIPFSKI